MPSLLIRNARLVNEGRIFDADLLVRHGRIDKIAPSIAASADEEIDAGGQWLLPGMIDDQVHFREPGLTHKGCIATESAAAVAGGITSFMDMPNTKPPTLSMAAVADKKGDCRARLAGQLRLPLRRLERQSRCRGHRRSAPSRRHQGFHGRLDRQHAGGRPSRAGAPVRLCADHFAGPLRG
jgi:dihydroorotase-like cyclic amidohydrolase